MRVAQVTTLGAYTLEIRAVANADGSTPRVELSWETRREIEENLTDLLPPGYSVRIKEWDE